MSGAGLDIAKQSVERAAFGAAQAQAAFSCKRAAAVAAAEARAAAQVAGPGGGAEAIEALPEELAVLGGEGACPAIAERKLGSEQDLGSRVSGPEFVVASR